MRLFCVAALAAGLLLEACGNSDDQAKEAAPPPDTSFMNPASTRTFTKKEFDNYAFNRTKEQIREEFGPPDGIHDDIDEWLYISTNQNLTVMDPDAGKQVSVSIRFIGVDGPADTVASVNY